MNEPSEMETLDFGSCSGTVSVTHIEGNRYRICGAEIAFINEEYGVGDIIEAFRTDSDKLLVVNRIECGNFRKFEYCLAPGWADRPEMIEVLDRILAMGGEWEGIFGGVLLVALPPETSYDPSEDIAKADRNRYQQ